MSLGKASAKPVAAMPALPPVLEMAEARQRLHDMVRRALGDVAVSHAAPASVAGERCVGLYLLELGTAAKQPRALQALQFCARFLVTVAGPDPAAACDDLAELAFAVLAEPDVEIDVAPLPVAAWAAFGAIPRPSLTLSMLLRRTRRVQPAMPVREAVLQLTQR